MDHCHDAALCLKCRTFYQIIGNLIVGIQQQANGTANLAGRALIKSATMETVTPMIPLLLLLLLPCHHMHFCRLECGSSPFYSDPLLFFTALNSFL